MSTLDCTQLSTWQTRLAEAEAAEHAIMAGSNVRKWVDQNGESVEYSRANVGQLQAYIAKLRGWIDSCVNGTGRSYRGPIRFTFGRRRC